MKSIPVKIFYLSVFLTLTPPGIAQLLLRQNGEAFNDLNHGGFQYQVNDVSTGSSHSHVQNNLGNGVNGQYQVLLPDGRLQTVTYVADRLGYRANVEYNRPAAVAMDINTLNKAALVGQLPFYQGLTQSRSSTSYPVYANGFQRLRFVNLSPFRSSDAAISVDNPLLTPETTTVPEPVSPLAGGSIPYAPVSAANTVPYTPVSCLQYNPITYICWVQSNTLSGFGPVSQLRTAYPIGVNGYSYSTPHSQVSVYQSG